VVDALGIVNVILGMIPGCPGGGCQSEVTADVIRFCESLEPYLSAEGFRHFMASVKAAAEVPAEFSLSQNVPNPFNASTTIRYTLSVTGPVHSTLTVYNLLGQEVRTLVAEPQEAGSYAATWDGTDVKGQKVSSGVYFYELAAETFRKTRKMVLLQ